MNKDERLEYAKALDLDPMFNLNSITDNDLDIYRRLKKHFQYKHVEVVESIMVGTLEDAIKAIRGSE